VDYNVYAYARGFGSRLAHNSTGLPTNAEQRVLLGTTLGASAQALPAMVRVPYAYILGFLWFNMD